MPFIKFKTGRKKPARGRFFSQADITSKQQEQQQPKRLEQQQRPKQLEQQPKRQQQRQQLELVLEQQLEQQLLEQLLELEQQELLLFRASSQSNSQQGGDQQGFFHGFSLVNSKIKHSVAINNYR
jgi:hypothetical protein